MKNRNKIYSAFFIFMLSLMTFGSCTRDELDRNNSVIIVEKAQEPDSISGKPTFTSWLKESYLKPYNIRVLYRFEDSQSDFRYNLAPAYKENSVQLAHLVKFMCIEPYDLVTGSKEFIKSSFPKELVFIGSTGINSNGTEIVGLAEGGRKITLYKVNALRKNDIVSLNEYYFHTIHHEYTHIQNQIKSYPKEFKTISGSEYVSGAWSDASTYGTPANIKETITKEFETEVVKELTDILPRLNILQDKVNKGETLSSEEQTEYDNIKNRINTILADPVKAEEVRKFEIVIKVLSSLTVSEVNALRKGFISPYGSSNDIEDIAEIQAFYITDSAEIWEAKMLIAGKSGAEKITAKLNILKSYLQSSWSLNLDGLRDEISKRVPKIKELDLDSFYTTNK